MEVAEIFFLGAAAVGEVTAVGEVETLDAVVGVVAAAYTQKLAARAESTCTLTPHSSSLRRNASRARDWQRRSVSSMNSRRRSKLAGETRGVLVGEAGAVHLHDRAGGEVLGRDELEAELLTGLLLLHDGVHLRE